MSIEPIHIAGAVFVGIGAALLMDLWNLFLRHTLTYRR